MSGGRLGNVPKDTEECPYILCGPGNLVMAVEFPEADRKCPGTDMKCLYGELGSPGIFQNLMGANVDQRISMADLGMFLGWTRQCPGDGQGNVQRRAGESLEVDPTGLGNVSGMDKLQTGECP